MAHCQLFLNIILNLFIIIIVKKGDSQCQEVSSLVVYRVRYKPRGMCISLAKDWGRLVCLREGDHRLVPVGTVAIHSGSE